APALRSPRQLVTLPAHTPSPARSGNGTATLGVPYNLTLPSGEPGQDPPDHWIIDWNDGSTPDTIPADQASDVTTAQHNFVVGTTTANVSATFYDDAVPWP